MKKVGQRKVRHGGLMRCCLATLSNHAEEDSEVGDELPCDYEGDDAPRLVVADDGVWEWVGKETALDGLTERDLELYTYAWL